MEIFRALGVKISGLNGSIGSGCIFQNQEKTYVLTAQHCLTEVTSKREMNEGDISNLTIEDIEGNRLGIVSVHIPQQEKLDFAVIEVQVHKKYPEVIVFKPESRMNYKFFGFPNYMAADNNPGESLDGYVSEMLGDNLILQHEQGILSDLDMEAKDNTVGYSGSGIYSFKSGNYFLIGILTSLRGKGEHGKLVGINIGRINEFLESKSLPELIPSKLKDFDLYFSTILEQEDEQSAAILRRVYRENFENISPHYLSELLNEKIAIPYDENFNSLNEEVWEGWVRLLLYLSLFTEKKISRENLEEYLYLSKESVSKNTVFYTKESKIQKFIRILYEDAYDDLCDEGIVFVNSKDMRFNKTIGTKRIKNIVKNIDSTVNSFYEKRGIDITNPNEGKNIAVVSLSYIMSEIEDVLLDCTTEKKNVIEIEKICIERLKKMFQEFENLIRLDGEYAIN